MKNVEKNVEKNKDDNDKDIRESSLGFQVEKELKEPETVIVGVVFTITK